MCLIPNCANCLPFSLFFSWKIIAFRTTKNPPNQINPNQKIKQKHLCMTYFFFSNCVAISYRPLIPPYFFGTINYLVKRFLRACVSYSLVCNQSLKNQGLCCQLHHSFLAICLKPRLLWMSAISAEVAMRRGRKLRWGSVCLQSRNGRTFLVSHNSHRHWYLYGNYEIQGTGY